MFMHPAHPVRSILHACAAFLIVFAVPLSAQETPDAPAESAPRTLSGEETYSLIQAELRGSASGLLEELDRTGASLDWTDAEGLTFEGNMRRASGPGGDLLLLRTLGGDVYLLSAVDSAFGDTEELLKNKYVYTVQTKRVRVGQFDLAFARITAAPSCMGFS